MEYVVLVDENDQEIGTMEKMEAHEKGLLHRAFSIFVFNDKKELMIQQRALSKYHSGGLWTNTCCSHPRKNESNIDAANRRLMEEMGFQCEMENPFYFTYKAVLDNELTEFEFDYVFIGFTNTTPVLNPNEAMDWKYMSLDMIEHEMKVNPQDFTEWFKIVFNEVKEELQKLI